MSNETDERGPGTRLGGRESRPEVTAARLGLAPHPEGGFFRETYRSSERVQTPRGERCLQTVVLYLMTPESPSSMHRVSSHEHWFHVGGDPIEHFVVHQNGELKRAVLGQAHEATTHVAVPPLACQAARVCAGGEWALVACVVSPGFEFADFELVSHEMMEEMLGGRLEAISGFVELFGGS
jgi:hypothetical protein